MKLSATLTSRKLQRPILIRHNDAAITNCDPKIRLHKDFQLKKNPAKYHDGVTDKPSSSLKSFRFFRDICHVVASLSGDIIGFQ